MSKELQALLAEEIGDAHESFSTETPLRSDAFDKSNEEKIAIITDHVRGILETLGMDLSDDSLQGCLLYTSPSPRDPWKSRMPSSA